MPVPIQSVPDAVKPAGEPTPSNPATTASGRVAVANAAAVAQALARAPANANNGPASAGPGPVTGAALSVEARDGGTSESGSSSSDKKAALMFSQALALAMHRRSLRAARAAQEAALPLAPVQQAPAPQAPGSPTPQANSAQAAQAQLQAANGGAAPPSQSATPPPRQALAPKPSTSQPTPETAQDTPPPSGPRAGPAPASLGPTLAGSAPPPARSAASPSKAAAVEARVFRGAGAGVRLPTGAPSATFTGSTAVDASRVTFFKAPPAPPPPETRSSPPPPPSYDVSISLGAGLATQTTNNRAKSTSLDMAVEGVFRFLSGVSAGHSRNVSLGIMSPMTPAMKAMAANVSATYSIALDRAKIMQAMAEASERLDLISEPFIGPKRGKTAQKLI